jgi:hypothetical protein
MRLVSRAAERRFNYILRLHMQVVALTSCNAPVICEIVKNILILSR